MTANPLPRIGNCPVCGAETRLRLNGRLFAHPQPLEAPVLVCTDDGHIADCPGSGRRTGLLEPTFARWLWAQSKRRDRHDNPITRLAQRTFQPCTRSPKHTPADVTWTTAAELHDELHRRQKDRTGSEIRQPYNGQRCDWACRDVERAAEAFGRLIEGAAA